MNLVNIQNVFLNFIITKIITFKNTLQLYWDYLFFYIFSYTYTIIQISLKEVSNEINEKQLEINNINHSKTHVSDAKEGINLLKSVINNGNKTIA